MFSVVIKALENPTLEGIHDAAYAVDAFWLSHTTPAHDVLCEGMHAALEKALESIDPRITYESIRNHGEISPL